ncbi:MAG: sodium:solute symporter family protein [Bradymonadales bacterium]|nr:MAG: sodium:solute symporter family protein [Bradymonadales bacterium]
MSKEFLSEIQLRSFLGPLDWFVFFLVLAVTLGAILWGHCRKQRASNEGPDFVDYLLMGRRLSLPLFVATLVATWYGGIFGVTRIAYEYGIYNFLTQGVFWYLSYLIFAIFLVSRARSFEALTLPEMVGKMFGPKSRYLAAAFNFFNVLPISYAISLGLFAQLLFGGSFFVNMSLSVAAVVLYSIWGGFRAVVFSDLIQFFVMCSGVALVVIFSFAEFGGLNFLRSHLPEAHFHWAGELGWGEALVWGFIAMATLVDPNFYQRCFAANSTRTARIGILVSTGVWVVFDICTTAGALYARAVLPEADSGFAYLLYAVQLLPEGLRGFFLAGILATILSTIDSYLFVAGSTVSYDLFPGQWQSLVKRMRLSLVVVAVLSVFMAMVFDGNIKLVWRTLGTYFAACLLFPVMFGFLFPKKISDHLFVGASLVGVVVVTLWRWSPYSEAVAALYPGLVSTSLVILGSLWLSRIRADKA